MPLLSAPIAIIRLIMKERTMKQFDFVLSFSVMADHELDARVKLKDLLKSISKEDIFWAMTIVKKEKDDA
jgi:hypothetical protein